MYIQGDGEEEILFESFGIVVFLNEKGKYIFDIFLFYFSFSFELKNCDIFILFFFFFFQSSCVFE